MLSQSRQASFLLAASIVVCPSAANAEEKITYKYDSLGRLIRVEHMGTVNTGIDSRYTYDAADNRTNVTVGTAANPAPPPPVLPPVPPPTVPPAPPADPPPAPPPTPTPTPSNQAPVTAPDSLTLGKCTIRAVNVTANDRDPEGQALTLVAVSGPVNGTAAVMDATFILYEAGRAAGSEVLTYTVRDALGATATGTLAVTIGGGTCPIAPLESAPKPAPAKIG